MAVVLAISLALVVGCSPTKGDSGHGTTPSHGTPTTASPAALPDTCWSVPQVGARAAPGAPVEPRARAVAAIAARLAEYQGSARFATSTCVNLDEGRGDRQISVSDGVADFAGGRFRYQQKDVPLSDPTRICYYEFVVLTGRYWGRFRDCHPPPFDQDPFHGPSTLTTDEPRLFTPWIPGVINGRYEFRVNPTKESAYKPPVAVRRQIVDALITRIEPAGSEELHNTPTWRYRLTLDRDRATSVLPASISAELAWDQYPGPAYQTLDVWLDAAGRLRRLVAVTGFFGQRARIGFELWDLGRAPSVDIPANLPGR